MESGSVALASSLHDRDEYGLPAYYTITYYKDPADAGLKLTANGSGANSGTGYVDLSWSAIEGADNYYVGVFNGKAYEYFYVGSQTSWSTKGRGIWPTEAEINNGRYTLHGDGSGTELPMLPALTYANAGSGHANDLNYYFTVIPANKYGQAPNPSNYAAQSVRLPDTLAPSVPESVTVSPATYTNTDEITVTWSGIKDYNNTSTSATTAMGSGGSIQYAIDSSSAWQNTDSINGSGSVKIDVSALADGQHYVYIRGVDSAGNTGTGKYAAFTIDRTAPTAPVLSVTPSDWTKLDSASITWSGIADANALDRVEYSLDGKPYVSTGKTEAAYAGYLLDISALSDGEHSLRLRGVDAAGNEGAAASVSIKRDTTPPTVTDAAIAPESWTNGDTATLQWTDLEDAHSGMKLVWYSLDNGGTWTAITPDSYVPMLSRPNSILIKAETGSGVLYGWTLTGVIETSPLRVSVKNLRGTDSIDLSSATVTKALTELAAAPQDAETLCQYEDGILVSDSFTYDARRVNQGESHAVALLALGADGTISGTGAKAETLLRENVNAAGSVVSQTLSGSGKIYALRLEALVTGSGLYSCSTDGETWTAITPGAYTVLDQAAEQVTVKADLSGGKLLAWHVEGVTLTESEITTELIQPPVNVTAADWSAYYANRAQWRYDLRWEDPSPEDDTADNTTGYEIYRNGQLIATVTDTQYTDTEYLANATYEIRTVRNYGEGFTPKASEMVPAKVTVMQPPADNPIGVNNTPEEQKQGEYLDKLYGGNYLFATEETAPTDERRLTNELLGSNKYCGYGFEPINFNTGNFLLETADASWADMGQAQLSLDRTYNSQSEAADGPFGAKWESAWSEHLRLYDSGEIVYAAPGGANIVFTPRPDGTYTGGEANDLRLTANRNEYHVTDAQGVLHAFSGSGLLQYLQWPDGSRISLIRDRDGLLTGLALPSGKKIDIESDRDGHITSIATLGGSALKYEYQGNNLVRFTGANGSVTRYEYDAQGRMTAWYDALGNVTSVLQKNGGRTVKYAYDAMNRLISVKGIDGSTTKYTYDARGQRIATDGAKADTSCAYDEMGNLISQTTTGAYDLALEYAYDLSGRMTKESRTENGATLESSYIYDALGQLTGFERSDGYAESYTYDPVGNMLSKSANGVKTRYTYNAANQLVSFTLLLLFPAVVVIYD